MGFFWEKGPLFVKEMLAFYEEPKPHFNTLSTIVRGLKAIGFSGQVVSNVERGYSFPSTEFVNRSATCFGVPADYILGRTTSRYAVADPKEVSAVQARVKTTRLAGGLLCPYKGLFPACARKAH